jgi:Fe-S cluster biogenesis protein NfuA
LWCPRARVAAPRKCGNVACVDEATKERADATSPAASGGEGVTGHVAAALSEFVVALVNADGGELYVVSATADDVHLHLSGTCAGCPGAGMTRERLLEPVLRNVAPKATLKVTTGWRIPEGARKIDAAST